MQPSRRWPRRKRSDFTHSPSKHLAATTPDFIDGTRGRERQMQYPNSMKSVTGAAQCASSTTTDWSKERATPRPSDVQLGGLAIAWSLRLDPAICPAELIKLYPRVANRLALCWADPILAGRLLDSLIKDRRGGRKGFPAAVRAELVGLRKLFPEERAVEPAGQWGLLATADR
jgi:hypothetical protein